MRTDIHANGRVLLAASVLLAAGGALAPHAQAQTDAACPYGYDWVPDYGCVAWAYLYGPPYYLYPDYSFSFFYGPYFGWGGGYWGGWYGRRWYGGGWYGRGWGWYGRGWAGYGHDWSGGGWGHYGGWGGFHGGGGWGGGFHGGGRH